MSVLILTEVCKLDKVMSESFMEKVRLKGSKVYNICEYTGIEIYLKSPEYRNNVKYRVKFQEVSV